MKLSLNPNTTTFSTLLLLFLVTARGVLSVPHPQDGYTSGEPVTQDEAESTIQDEFNAEVSGQAQYESLPEPVPLTPEEEAALNAAATAPAGNASVTTTTNTTLTDAELEEILNGATGTVAPLPETSDPCGPKVQDGTQFNTCTRNPDGTTNVDGSPYVHYTEEPAYYGVQCLPAAPGVTQKLDLEQCEFSRLCNATQKEEYSRDEWHWDEYGGEGCAVGIYIPGGADVTEVAMKPDRTRCEYAIFRTMGLYCEGGGEIAAVNVQTLPAGDAPGEAANPGYPRYIIAPQIL
ncbi:MAG: hypothetical protein LQ341_002265 [Variospora aurantia]|nr:MAG: hypothetical protein LQ341_002265 [Variospora aurantia]